MISPKSPKLYQSSVHQSATADATKVFACKPTALHAHPTIIVNAIPYKDTIRIAFPKRLEIRFSQMKDRRRARELAAEFIQISETAIRASRKRFPHSTVEYHAANLLAPPPHWRGQFDFVFEANTLQVLPASLRPPATKNIASFLPPGGLLLVVARGREPSDPEGQMPWPLTRSEISAFAVHGLEELLFDIIPDLDEPGVRRFRALFRLP